MANFVFDKLISPLFLVLLFCASVCRAQTVPATYVFGDLLVDVGNNNYLPLSLFKANFPYNGIDYLGRFPTGRFSNGKNAVDFIAGAEQLGLPPAPLYLSQPFNVFVKGVSFASGGAGILHSSDPPFLAQTVPATYVFGDSLVDVGNNNHLPLSLFKANIPYNGVDYLGKKATGRFSNGKNAADFLAEQLGLPTAPPYLSQPNNVFVKGVSFASGGAGIFNTSDPSLLKETISLPHQVMYFSSVHQRLVKEMGANAVQQHLSKSLFPVVIGNNDIIGYFSTNSEMAKKYTPQQYVTLMLSNLKELLKGIHGLGARKFLLVGLPPIGCAPKQRYSSATDECNEEVNNWSKKYNEELKQMLATLQSELKDFRYSFFDTYSIFLDFIKNPTIYGFNETKSACCGLGKLKAELPCTPLAVYCSDRSSHLFWDIYHPTEAAARIFISKLFDGDYVTPVTVKQLITL